MSDLNVIVRLDDGDFVGTGTTIVYQGISGGTNLGTGEGIFKNNTGNTVNFKTLKAVGGASLSSDGDSITISASTSGGGGTSDGVVNGATMTGDTLHLSRTQGLPDVTVDLSQFNESASIASVSADTVQNTSDIASVSGQSDQNTSDIQTITGDTASLRSDLNTVSGQTDTNTSAIADNAADIVYLSGVTSGNTADIGTLSSAIASIGNDVTGNTAAIANKLDSVVGGTNVTVDNTDPNNPIINVTASGITDGVVSGATMSGNTLELSRTEGLADVTVDLSQFDQSGDITYLSGQTDTKASQADLVSHTGDSTIHYPMSGISITESQISDFGSYVTDATFTGYTATTETALDAKTDKNLSIVTVTGASIIEQADNGKAIECDGTFTLTFDTGLTTGFQCTIVNAGSGTITLAAPSGGSLQTKDSATQLANQYGAASAYNRGSNTIIAFGDLS